MDVSIETSMHSLAVSKISSKLEILHLNKFIEFIKEKVNRFGIVLIKSILIFTNKRQIV